MVALILLSFLAVLLAYYWGRHLIWTLRVSRVTANIPGPKPLPLIGNALLFLDVKSSEDVFHVLKTINHQYSDPDGIIKIWFGPKLIIGTSNPNYINIILSSADAIDKDDVYELLKLIGNGVFTENGEKWKELRKPLNKMMHKNKIESMLTLFHDKSKIFCELLKKLAENAEIVDLKHPTALCMGDIVSVFGLGHDLNEMEHDSLKVVDDIERSVKQVAQFNTRPPYSCLNKTLVRMTWKARQITNRMSKHFMLFSKIIEERSRLKEQIGGESDEIYADLIHRIAERDRLNQKDIGKLFIDFFVAGFDTTSVITSGTLLMLAMYPEHQEAVYKEQVELLGKDPDVAPTWQQLSSMDYLTRVIKEVMRLFPPVGITRQITNDVNLGKFTIPKDCSVYISILNLHRRSEFWSHPEEFYPDHFLPEAVASRPKAAYLPFSWGPRGCPGGQFAMAAARTIISTVVRTFRLETELKLDELRYSYGLLTEVEQGYLVRLFPRDATSHHS